MRFILAVFLCVFSMSNSYAGALPFDKIDGNFQSPESSFFDSTSKSVFISNVGKESDPRVKTMDGSISRVNSNGEVVSDWLTGLQDPKGISIHGTTLYVADITTLYIVDISSIEKPIVDKIEIADAEMLNDVAIDKTTDLVYISDTWANKVFVLDPKNASKKPKSLFGNDFDWEGPNGLTVSPDGKSIYVAAWGPIEQIGAWKTTRPGRVFKVDLQSQKKESVLENPKIKNLDGIEFDPNNPNRIFVTDWVGEALYILDLESDKVQTIHGIPGAADIGIVPNPTGQGLEILVPSMSTGQVRIYSEK